MIPAALLAVPWGKVARAGVVVAGVVLVLGTPFVLGWRLGASRTEARLNAAHSREVAAYELKLQTRDQVLDTMRDASLKAAGARDVYERLYRAATARPPEVVVEYRERVRDIPGAVESPVCAEAVGEAVAFVHELAELERGLHYAKP